MLQYTAIVMKPFKIILKLKRSIIKKGNLPDINLATCHECGRCIPVTSTIRSYFDTCFVFFSPSSEILVTTIEKNSLY